MFDWNWPSGPWDEDFQILSTYYYYFIIIFPWKRALPLILTNLNPFPPRMLCAKFGWNWHSKYFFLISLNVFSLFRSYLPLRKSVSFIWLNLNTLYPKMLCAKFDWNWLCVSFFWEEDENVKSLQRDRQTDNRQQATRKAHI